MTPEFEKAIAPVREWLVQGAPHTEAGEGFSMSHYYSEALEDYQGHACGTAMCIAGAMKQFNPEMFPGSVGLAGQYDAEKFLGMTPAQVDQLFHGYNADGSPYLELRTISPAMAVDAIDQMLSTGEVNWRTDV